MRGAMLAVGLCVATSADAGPLRLLTYNVEFDNPNPGATLDAIAGVDADVVVLQEVTAAWQHALARRFAKAYPHQAFRIAHAGLAVLSKQPISDEEALAAPDDDRFHAQRVVIGGIQILNLHLRPQIDRGSWIRGHFTTPPVRRREVAAYWPVLAGHAPTLVAGDFNEDVDGQAIEFFVAHGLAVTAADGPKTWHLTPLAIDLDHVMIDDALVARDGHVLDVGTSDHRPVVVTIDRK